MSGLSQDTNQIVNTHFLISALSKFHKSSVWNGNIQLCLQSSPVILWVDTKLIFHNNLCTIHGVYSTSPKNVLLLSSLILSSHCYQNCHLPSSLSAHCYSAHCPICGFNMTRTCHLWVVGDSHAADVVIGCRRHLSSTSGAVTGDGKEQKIGDLHEFAWIYKRVYCGSNMRYDTTD